MIFKLKENIEKNQNVTNNITGVLLVNLGTPDKPSYTAVQRYLREFLSDRRVIEVPKLVWTMILYFFILPLRPLYVAKKYAGIWLKNGSPLLVYSRCLKDALQQQLQNDHVDVQLAMRYGNPNIKQAMQYFKEKHIRRLIILPLYPQYSATTVATTFDAVSDQLKQWRFVPELKFISGYADFEPYIDAITNSITRYWQSNQRSEKLLISFHGLPKRNLLKGDPYYCFCHKTARLIAEKLKLDTEQWQMVFQSRFGKAEWLQPYCSETLKQYATAGIKTVDVVCPGFPVDCLETLEEISETYAHEFKQHGGKSLHYIPALNTDEMHVSMLENLIRKQL